MIGQKLTKEDTWKALKMPVHRGLWNCKNKSPKNDCKLQKGLEHGKHSCNCYTSMRATIKHGMPTVDDEPDWLKSWGFNGDK